MQSISSSNITADATGRKKEALLIRVIHHWRCLDISAVFYAWFKYSARKKYLKQNYQFLIEKKEEFLLHSTFLKWNRTLYCKQASTEFAVSYCRLTGRFNVRHTKFTTWILSWNLMMFWKEFGKKVFSPFTSTLGQIIAVFCT